MPQQAAQQARSELTRLVARRDALRDQIESMTSRRGTLAQERLNAQAREAAGGGASDRAMVSQYEQRITELGTRIRALEQELDKTEDQIADARTKLGDAEAGDIAPPVPGVPDVPAIVGGFAGFPNAAQFAFPGSREREALLRSKYQTMMIAEGATLLLLAVIGWRIVWVSAKRRFARGVDAIPGMMDLRQSVDAIAVEVERISENQRYVTRMLSEGQGPARKVDVAASESARKP